MDGRGCFILYIKVKQDWLTIDATEDTGRVGRLVNHSIQKANAVLQLVEVEGLPRVFLMAKCGIACGQEILYDYGDRKSELEWLKM